MGGRGASGIKSKALRYDNSEELRSLREESEKWIGGLSDSEKDSIYQYTSVHFRDINPMLRSDKDPILATRDEVSEWVTNIDSALAKAELSDDIVVYRGIDESFFGEKYTAQEINEFIAGHTLTDKGYWSTSANKESLPRFADQKPYVMEVKVPKGTGRGQYVSQISAHKKEDEYLISRGSSYKIVSARQERGKIVIEAELVPKGR